MIITCPVLGTYDMSRIRLTSASVTPVVALQAVCFDILCQILERRFLLEHASDAIDLRKLS